MAFRTSTIQASALNELMTIAVDIKARSVEVRDFTANNANTSAAVITSYLMFLVVSRDRLNVLKTTPGLAAYARAQYDDQSYDIVAEYQALFTQLEATIDWMVAAIPKDANGYALLIKYADTGQTVRTFTSAALANLRTQIDALVATIN